MAHAKREQARTRAPRERGKGSTRGRRAVQHVQERPKVDERGGRPPFPVGPSTATVEELFQVRPEGPKTVRQHNEREGFAEEGPALYLHPCEPRRGTWRDLQGLQLESCGGDLLGAANLSGTQLDVPPSHAEVDTAVGPQRVMACHLDLRRCQRSGMRTRGTESFPRTLACWPMRYWSLWYWTHRLHQEGRKHVTEYRHR